MFRTLIAASVFALAAQSAQAAVITISGSFTATNWVGVGGPPVGASPAPVIDPLYLSYSVTFDDAMDYLNDTSVLTIFTTNSPYPISFTYNSLGFLVPPSAGGPPGARFPGFALASVGHPDFACLLGPGTLCAIITDFTTGRPAPFDMVQLPVDNQIFANGGVQAGIVPEPSTWMLMILGFGLIAQQLRRRTQAALA
jgi:hypothetical protein